MKYVAFLRAINVGGHAIIKMLDLKKMFESAGLENVQTYIQSGNVIFESEEEDTDVLSKRIQHPLKKAAEYKIHLFVRTMREVRSIAEKSPFTAKGAETVFVAFLQKKPDRKSQQALLSFKSDVDDFAVKGREVYNLRRGRENSIFSTNFVEKILKMPATIRKGTTITKILEKFT
ncbi:MAG TPA: DUF1697 domain-containing protein [Anaerolineales bacterium]|nr:DUF1697 domain-containing protein [Anaerolineales bacterium]